MTRELDRGSGVATNSMSTPPPDYSSKGFLIAKFVKPAYDLIPSEVDVCPNFVFNGRECKDGRNFQIRHAWQPKLLAMQDLKFIGDKFLSTGKGCFAKENFKDCLMKSLYDPLFLNNNGNIFTRTQLLDARPTCPPHAPLFNIASFRRGI